MASIAPSPADFADAKDTTQEASPPNPLWTFAEGRAMFELAAFYAARPMLSMMPKGDGHCVLVMPGFMASNRSTQPMRSLLSTLGYDTHGWNSGRNVRINDDLIDRLEGQLDSLYRDSGRQVSIVGWSLGGVLAREIAKMHPEKVRLVMSLGSPISDNRAHTNASRLFEVFNRDEPENLRGGQFRGLDVAPPVPTTSVITKTDGIVHWRGSVQQPGSYPTENIQVYSSHCGLGVNPSVMVAIADRLSQPEGEWAPFEAQPHQDWMFPKFALD